MQTFQQKSRWLAVGSLRALPSAQVTWIMPKCGTYSQSESQSHTHSSIVITFGQNGSSIDAQVYNSIRFNFRARQLPLLPTFELLNASIINWQVAASSLLRALRKRKKKKWESFHVTFLYFCGVKCQVSEPHIKCAKIAKLFSYKTHIKSFLWQPALNFNANLPAHTFS